MKLYAAAFLCVICACGPRGVPAPDPIGSHVEHTPEGRYLVLELREPVSVAQVQAAIDAHRDTILLVRAFTYVKGHQPGTDTPASVYQWTAGNGLKRLH